jgi:hypothetical protein
MAVERAEYEVFDGFPDMCARVIAETRDRYGHIDPTSLRMAMMTNMKPAPDGALFKVIRVSEPLAMRCPFPFLVVTWHRVWDQIGERGRKLVISNALDCLRPEA